MSQVEDELESWRVQFLSICRERILNGDCSESGKNRLNKLIEEITINRYYTVFYDNQDGEKVICEPPTTNLTEANNLMQQLRDRRSSLGLEPIDFYVECQKYGEYSKYRLYYIKP